MKKGIISVLLLFLIPLSALAFTLHCLETYNNVVHGDTGFLVCGFSVFAFLASLAVWGFARKRGKHITVIWIISTLILVFVFYVA